VLQSAAVAAVGLGLSFWLRLPVALALLCVPLAAVQCEYVQAPARQTLRRAASLAIIALVACSVLQTLGVAPLSAALVSLVFTAVMVLTGSLKAKLA
jgi:hypothetical protein